MKFYKEQYGPVLSIELYAEALRQLAFERGEELCVPEYGHHVTEDAVVRKIVNLKSPKQRAGLVQVAAALDRSNPDFAERWFLNKLGLLPKAKPSA